VQTGDEETTDTGIDHNAVITSDNVALNVTAAILVGGQARRLGGRLKPSIQIGDARILDRQLAAIRLAGIDDITLVGRWPDPIPPQVHHVSDAVAESGPLGGVYTALLVATGPIVVVLAGDMPFVTAGCLRMLADIGNADAKVPRTGTRWHPLCAAYHRRTAATFKQRLDQGALRLTDALALLNVREVGEDEIDTTGMLLMNVNTPDDMREAEHLARLHP
jgi:molybdopterin-guanine dinucleotide biosynthesis protein A